MTNDISRDFAVLRELVYIIFDIAAMIVSRVERTTARVTDADNDSEAW